MDTVQCKLAKFTMLTAWTQCNASWPSLQLARAVHVFHLTCHHPDSFFTVTCTTAPSGTDISSSSSASWSSVTTKLSVEDKVHTQCTSNMHIHACKHVHTHGHIAYTTCKYVCTHTYVCNTLTHTHTCATLYKDSYQTIYLAAHTVTYQGWLGSLVVLVQPPDEQERWRVPSHVFLHRLPSTTLHSNGLRTLGSCVCMVTESHDSHMAVTWQSHGSHMIVTWQSHDNCIQTANHLPLYRSRSAWHPLGT